MKSRLQGGILLGFLVLTIGGIACQIGPNYYIEIRSPGDAVQQIWCDSYTITEKAGYDSLYYHVEHTGAQTRDGYVLIPEGWNLAIRSN